MSDSVRAVAFAPDQPHRVHPATVPLPHLGAGDVEIDVIRVGVCGTDREIIAGEIGFPPTGHDELVIGHEVIGRVRAVGPDVNAVAIGDLVTVTVRRPDDCPACQSGEPDMCMEHRYTERGIAGADGFMAERIVENEHWVIRIPDHLEPVGVLTEPLTVVEKAVRQAHLIQRRLKRWNLETAVVMGAGPIGLLGTLLLRSQGADVYTVARTPAPNPAATLVAACGAHYVSTHETPLAELVRSLPGIDLILECSGSSRVVFESMEILGNNGVLVLLSLTPEHDTAEIPVGRLNRALVAGNKVVVGSVNAGMEDFTNAVASLDRFEALWPGLTATMITHRFSLGDDLVAATGKLPGGIKSVIEFTHAPTEA